MGKENQILHYIRLNPFISQKELSSKVGLSRSAVANAISDLVKKGIIKGRAYVLREEFSISCIGAANVDQKARAKQKTKLFSSNPVVTSDSCGGVARNIAENLSRLGCNTSLITCVGNDKEGEWLLEKTKSNAIDVSNVWILPTERTGTYTALLDIDGEMIVSLADMEIYDKIKPDMIDEKWSNIAGSQAVFLDTNIPGECISYIINRCKREEIPLYIDPVSSAKARKLPEKLDGVELIIPNQEEAELLSGMKIEKIKDCLVACEKIKNRGVKKVIITLGEEGAYYYSSESFGHLPAFDTKVVDVTGAGDAFTSCVIYGMMRNETLRNASLLGLAGADVTLTSEQTVSSFLQAEKIHDMIKEFI